MKGVQKPLIKGRPVYFILHFGAQNFQIFLAFLQKYYVTLDSPYLQQN